MTLIKRAKSQPDAFVRLYDLYVERIYQYLLRRLQHPQMAEDLCGQVWEKVLKKIGSLRSNEERSFAGWLFSIARNELNQHFRIHKKTSTQELPEGLADESKDPSDLMEDLIEADHLRELLLVLPTKQKEAVELRYFAELRNKEIAVILNISEKTVASNLSRALKTLKSRLEKLQ